MDFSKLILRPHCNVVTMLCICWVKKTIVMFEISSLEFVQKQCFLQNFLFLWNKNPLFRYCWSVISKTVFMFDIRSVEFALNAKFQAKIKILKLCTKTALCWYFWVAVLKSLSYLKSVLLKYSNYSVLFRDRKTFHLDSISIWVFLGTNFKKL